jgi:hypothetical protein
MKKIKDWVYLLFRPKWERRLYKLLKHASCQKSLCLDTLLYGYRPSQEMEGKLFKAGIDAMFIGWLGFFNAKNSAKYLYSQKAQNVVFELASMSDSSAPEVAMHKTIMCNLTLGEYLESMAVYVTSDNVSENDRLYLTDLSRREYLGLSQCWQKRQKAAQKMLIVLFEEGIKPHQIYAENFAGADYATVLKIKTKLRKAVDLKASQATTKGVNDWASMLAYFASLIY